MIWADPKYHHECRSNIGFYTTPGHQVMRKHAAILMGILKDGVAEGVFRDDTNLHLIREIIYSVLDFEAISKIAIGELEESVKDFDDVMSLILTMVTAPKQGSETDKQSLILKAAEEIFSQKGFGKARVSEIAQLANVAERTIYDYFENKEALLLSIPEMRLKNHVDALGETFHVISPLRKLRRFIKQHFWLYLPNRDFLKVFLLDVQLNKRFYGSRAFQLFQTYLTTIEDIIAEGKARKCFRADINPRVFRNMFLGAFSHMALRWLIIEKVGSYDKMVEIEQLTDLLCLSVTTA